MNTTQNNNVNPKYINMTELKKLPLEQRITVFYTRVSTEDQAKNGYSIEDQLSYCQEWSNGKEWNYYPILVVSDEGVSATIGWRDPEKPSQKYRKGFNELWNLLRSGRVANIVTAYGDRLSRKDRYAAALADECFEQGTHIHLRDIGEYLESEEKRTLLMVNSIIASDQAVRGRAKVRDSIKQRVKEGYPPGKVPFGWKNHVRTEAEVLGRVRPYVEPHIDQKHVLLMIKDWYITGLSSGQIATKLTAIGIQAPRGTKWHSNVVMQILLNPFHAGWFNYKGQLTEGQHKQWAFWSMNDLDELKRIYDRRKKTNHPFEHSDLHLLGGLIICSKCGNPIRFGSETRSKTGAQYYCEYGCKGVRARVDLIDSYVIDQVRQMSQLQLTQEMAREEAVKLLAMEYDDPSETIQNLERRKNEINSASKRNYDGWIRGYATDDQFSSMKTELEKEMKAVDEELEQYRSLSQERSDLGRRLEDVVKLLSSFDKIWGELKRSEQRELLYQACQSLELDSGVNGKAILRVRTFFLDEVEYLLPSYKFSAGWNFGPYEGLMVSWLACAKLRLDGLSVVEIAKQRNIGLKTAKMYLSKIGKATGAKTIDEALEIIRPYLDEIPSALLMREQHGNSRGSCSQLTETQVSTLKIRGESSSIDEAAQILGISRIALNSRLYDTYHKLGASNLKEALEKAQSLGTVM